MIKINSHCLSLGKQMFRRYSVTKGTLNLIKDDKQHQIGWISGVYNSNNYTLPLITKSFSTKQCNESGKDAKGSKKEKEKSKCKEKGKPDKEQQCDKSKVSEIPRIAINGFGRIGRMVMRVAVEHSCPLEIVAINDPNLTPEYMAYALQYDSTHGRFVGDVEVKGKEVLVDGKRICAYSEADPKNIPWKDIGVDYVVESSGKFKSAKASSVHLTSGAKKVVVSAPIYDGPMYVVGVNLDTYDAEATVVSSSSCATTALAPLAKVINDNFGIEEGFMATVHSVTPTQKILDGLGSPGKKWRDGRGGLQNIIPSSTGADKALGKVIPELEGKIKAMSIRVPVPNVSLLNFTIRLKKDASMEDVTCALCEARDGAMAGIIDVTRDEVVSSDFNGSHFSCILDASSSISVNNKFLNIIAWYDNEYGFTCRLIDLIKFMHAEQLSQE